jgi:beta-lactamase class A
MTANDRVMLNEQKIRLTMAAVLCISLLFAPLMGAARGKGSIDSNKIEGLIRESGAEAVAVAFYDLAGGEEFFIRPDESFHAASTMKVPVMMEVFRQAKEGMLSLEDYIAIKNEFISIADNTRYSIAAESDSEQSLYKRIGQAETVRELVSLMINASSNLATNLLIERVTAPRIMKLMEQLGAKNIRVLRGVEDSKAYSQGLNNTTTARDLMIILRSIAERRAVSSKASDEMVKILLEQKFNEGIPAGLPASVRVAHKTGSITRINHDAAIVFPADRKPYVIVVLTRGIEDEKRAHKLIADISRVVFDSVTESRRARRP